MYLEPIWRPMRKNLIPAFYPNALKSYIPIFNRKSKVLTEIVQKKPANEPVDMIHLLYAANLDIVQGKILMISDLRPSNYING